MTVMRRAVCLGMFIASTLGGAQTARAQGSAAEALFEEGRKALAAGDLDTACARFRASDRIEPEPGTTANLAECEEKRGKVATAWELNRTALGKLPAGDPRAAILKLRIQKLEARLPRLLLKLAEGADGETTVREGTVLLGSADTYGVALPLDPGVHHLVVTAPGRAAKTVDVTLAEGATEAVAVAPGPAAAPAPKPDRPPGPPSRSEAPPNDSPSPGPWIVGGIGLAALVAGGVTGALVMVNRSTVSADCSDAAATCTTQSGITAASAVRTLGPVTTAALVAGAAGVATGGVWMGVRRAPSVRLGVAPTAGGASWRLATSW